MCYPSALGNAPLEVATSPPAFLESLTFSDTFPRGHHFN